ncbi:MAG: sulfatase, partial [Planctomycetales bacterium]
MTETNPDSDSPDAEFNKEDADQDRRADAGQDADPPSPSTDVEPAKTAESETAEQEPNPITIPAWETGGAMFLTAIWFGFATGWVESICLMTRYYTETIVLYQLDGQFAWLVVLGNVGLYLPAAALIGGLAWLCPGQLRFRVAVGCLLAPLFIVPVMHLSQGMTWGIWPPVSAFFGACCAFKASEALANRAETFHRWKGRTLAAMVVLMLLVAWGSQRPSAPNPLPAVANKDAPNVLLIVMDTVRAENMSFHGYHRQTVPNLEKLLEKGVVFDKATSTAPWTLTSHAGMFTGRHPFELSCIWHKTLDDKHPTLAEVLSREGYATGGFVSNYYFCGEHTKLDRGFQHYQGCRVLSGEPFRLTVMGNNFLQSTLCRDSGMVRDLLGRKEAPVVNEEFLGWLSKQEEDRPFFAFLNYYDPHSGFLNGAKLNKDYPPRTWEEYNLLDAFEEGFNEGEDYTKEQADLAQHAYDGCIEYLDLHLGKLFDELERRGKLDNTLIIVTSDHGEHFGEHDLYGHGGSVYEPLQHVPLIIRYPKKIPARLRVSQRISLRDLAATVSEISGVNNSPFPGRSLSRFWDEENTTDAGPEPVLSQVILPGWARYDKGLIRAL